MSYNQSEKLEIIKLVEESAVSVKQTLDEIGIAKSTFYEWYRKYLKQGEAELKNKYKIPYKIWNKIPEEEQDKVIDLALEYPEKSSRKIACLMIDKNKYFISETSVYRILKAKNLIGQPAYAINTAKEHFEEATTRINEL